MRKSFSRSLHDRCDPPARRLIKMMVENKELDHLLPDYEGDLNVEDLSGATADLKITDGKWEVLIELEWRQKYFNGHKHYGIDVAGEVNVPWKQCFAKNQKGYFISLNSGRDAYLVIDMKDVSNSPLGPSRNKYKEDEYMYKVPADLCKIYDVASDLRQRYLDEEKNY